MDIYVYAHEDMDTTLFVSERELTPKETYCPTCREHCRFLGTISTKQELDEIIASYGDEMWNPERTCEHFERLLAGETYDDIDRPRREREAEYRKMYEEEVKLTKKTILAEILANSPEIAEHLLLADNLSNYNLLLLICCAPISLERKVFHLRQCQEFIWDEEDGTRCAKYILLAEDCLRQMEAKEGELFLWRSCWYDEEYPDAVGCSRYEPCKNMQEVYTAIKEELAKEDRGNLPEYPTFFAAKKHLYLAQRKEVDELEHYPTWYEVQKWVPNKNNPQKLEFADLELTIVNGEICYFKQEHTILGDEYFRDFRAFEGTRPINIPLPFEVGDILEIDCRPFAEVQRAVFIEDTGTITGTQLAFLDSKGNLKVGPLKMCRHFSYPYYYSKLPGIYSCRKFEGELPESEKVLEKLRERILKRPIEERTAFGRGVWETVTSFISKG